MMTAPDLASITARTRIVHGGRDPFYPIGTPLEIYAAISRSPLWIIANGGHSPILADMPSRFVETALAFVCGDWERWQERMPGFGDGG